MSALRTLSKLLGPLACMTAVGCGPGIEDPDLQPAQRQQVVSGGVYEAGSITLATSSAGQWQTVQLSKSFTNPVVVLGPASHRDAEPTTVRIKSVDSDSFQVQLDEWNYLNGQHGTETLAYMVMEAGVHRLGGRTWEAGVVSSVNHNFKRHTFTHSYGGSQTLLTQVGTYRGRAAVTTRVQNMTSAGFDVRVQEEEGGDGVHLTETVYYLAVSVGAGTAGSMSWVANQTGDSVEEDWFGINFGRSLSSPLIFAGMHSFDGPDPAALRYRNLGASGVEIRVQEERSSDTETDHTTETVGYLAVGGNSVPSSPNVVLFLVDDMGWTDWQRHATRNPTGSIVYETPNMLRLAREGVTFRQAYASAPNCSPTRASIMTGKTPARHRMTETTHGRGLETAKLREPNYRTNLPNAEVTLAEAFADVGYATGFVGKWHLGLAGNNAANPLRNGFDFNVAGNEFGWPQPAGGFFASSDGMWRGMPGLDTPGAYPGRAYLSDALADHMEDFIDHSTQDGLPFFLMASHYLVHVPLEAPRSLVDTYTQKINNLRAQGRDLNGHDNPVYAAMVKKMDQSLGRLLDRLDDPNGDGDGSDSVRDNTIIVFASDNGGYVGATKNRPLRESKGSLYEGGIRGPFLVSWTGNPSITRGSVSNARTSSVDIYPTLLAMTGVPMHPGQGAAMDGVSIEDAIEGQSFGRGYQHWHRPHHHIGFNGSDGVGKTFSSAVRKANWKLIYFYEDSEYQLFDLYNDLGETTNVLGTTQAARNAAIDLSRALHEYLDGVNAQMPIDKNTSQPVPLPPILSR